MDFFALMVSAADVQCTETWHYASDGLRDDGGPDAVFEFKIDAEDVSYERVAPGSICMTALTCFFASDSGSDDGSPGSEFPVCAFGAVCVDCGVRTASPPPPPHSPATICMNKCLNAGGSECSDDGGGPGSEFATSAYATDCVGCGSRVSMPSPPPRSAAAHPAPNPPPNMCSNPWFYTSDWMTADDGLRKGARQVFMIALKLLGASVNYWFPYEDTAGDPVEEAAKRVGVPLLWAECFDGALVLLRLASLIWAVSSVQERSGRSKRFATWARHNRSYRNKCFELALLALLPPSPSMASPSKELVAWHGRQLTSHSALLALGMYHTCLADGALLKCWGLNDNGQLGDNTTTARAIPTTIDVGGAVGLLAAGNSHTCAYVTANALLKCWGKNINYGQLGDGTTTDRATPTTINVGGAVGLLALGGLHTCAYLISTLLKCWGSNGQGQLGDGTYTHRYTPTTIDVGGAVGLLALGGYHTCAYLTNSTLLKCWGRNVNGQLGDNTTTTRKAPTTIDVGGAVGLLALGEDHTCVYLTASTLLKCWGRNYYGGLGYGPSGSAIYRAAPTTIDVGGAVGLLVLGLYHTCAYVTDGAGTLKCWGANYVSQLGDGTTTNSATPTTINVGGAVGLLELGDMHTCAYLGDGTIGGWANLTTIDVGGAVGLLALGGSHTCAYLTSSALLKCWGRNDNGQLGNGTTSARYTPTTINVGGAVGLLALGGSHTCAYLISALLKCWGSNSNGQRGDGTTTNRYTPTTIDVGGAVGLLALGGSHTCAYVTNSTLLKCWGWNVYGQLGDNTTTDRATPTTINVGGAVGLLALGWYHTCAYVTNSTLLKCWGYNAVGQLGDGTTTHRTTPTTIDVGGAVGLLALGGFHTCAYLTSSALLKCWGSNGYGQLGDGTKTSRKTPTTIDVSGAVGLLALGWDDTCAYVTASALLKCWGYNGYGQLGDGTTTSRITPA
eukprot:jgi/Chrpa1/15823/Chrysochromulina_OHIO_Genome00024666-RA